MLNKFNVEISQEETNKVDTLRYAFQKLLEKSVSRRQLLTHSNLPGPCFSGLRCHFVRLCAILYM